MDPRVRREKCPLSRTSHDHESRLDFLVPIYMYARSVVRKDVSMQGKDGTMTEECGIEGCELEEENSWRKYRAPVKEVVALQLSAAMRREISKARMAECEDNRSQVTDLDPNATSRVEFAAAAALVGSGVC